MQNYIKEYRQIIQTLVLKSFPELKNKKISIEEKDAPYRAHVVFWPWSVKLLVAKKIRNFSYFVKRRILVHELCHLSIFYKQGFIWTGFEYLLYMLSPSVRKRVEAKAIFLMLEKGYTKEVLSALRDNQERGLPYALTEKEIKQYIKNFKK